MLAVLRTEFPSLHEGALLILVIFPLSVVLRRVRARIKHGSSQRRDALKGRHGDDVDPAPSYLASSIDDAELIGGDPSLLPPLRGPNGHTIIFRSYTPPSLDGEIPKVDLYGAVNFIRTGKVRTFVHTGARRLLVVDLRGMTLGVHVLRQAKKRKRRGNGNDRGEKQSGGSLFSDEGGHKQRSGGIRISTRRLSFDDDFDEDEDEFGDVLEESEEDWDPRKYEPNPSLLLKLDDIASISAIPPRCGGVLEILSHSEAGPRPNSNVGVDDDAGKGHDKVGSNQRGNKKGGASKGKSGQPRSPRNNSLWLEGAEKEERLCLNAGDSGASDGPEYVAKSIIDEDDGSAASSGAIERRDEFAFPSPRDAAEFQRMIMALRTVGREIMWLYEALEAVPPSLPITDKAADGEPAHDMFACPGVPLDDVRSSLGEMLMLKRGMDQFAYLINREEDRMGDGLLLEEEAGNPRRQHVLGIVDFFSLFVPPLSSERHAVVPCFVPCAEPGSYGNDNMDSTGVEWHHQRLGFVSALQRLVGRAAMYVRTYVGTRTIAHDGWRLNKESSKQMGDSNSGSGDNNKSISNDVEDQTESDSEDANATPGEPGAILSSGDWHPTPGGDLQGYSCIGWHAFLIHASDEGTNGLGCPSWPSPDSDPLDCVPGLRAVVEKYPHAHFFVFSHFNEQHSVAAYFLFVRSLPVGIDRGFDYAVNELACGSAKERDWRFGLSVQVAPGQGSSLTTRVALTSLRALYPDLTKAVFSGPPRLESFATKLVSVWHFGGSARPVPNYLAVNSQLPLKMYPSLRFVRACLRHTSSVDLTYELKAYIDDFIPERSISSIKLENVNINKCVRTKGDGSNTHIVQNNSRTSNDGTKQPETSLLASNNDELYGSKIDTVLELLENMLVPLRKRDQTRGEHNLDNRGEIISVEHVLVSRSDVERYLISCECDIRATVARMVESAIWRSFTFPVDTRSCTVEDRSGQFFQMGHCLMGNPIFYLCTMEMGPSRSDAHAIVLSILHRLEMCLSRVEAQCPGVKITLIALIGHHVGMCGRVKSKRNGNPRIDQFEEHHSQSSIVCMQLLNDLLLRHYPGRIAKTLVVPSKTWKKKGRLLRELFQNASVLSSQDGLKKYVDKDELIDLVGGNRIAVPRS